MSSAWRRGAAGWRELRALLWRGAIRDGEGKAGGLQPSGAGASRTPGRSRGGRGMVC